MSTFFSPNGRFPNTHRLELLIIHHPAIFLPSDYRHSSIYGFSACLLILSNIVLLRFPPFIPFPFRFVVTYPDHLLRQLDSKIDDSEFGKRGFPFLILTQNRQTAHFSYYNRRSVFIYSRSAHTCIGLDGAVVGQIFQKSFQFI